MRFSLSILFLYVEEHLIRQTSLQEGIECHGPSCNAGLIKALSPRCLMASSGVLLYRPLHLFFPDSRHRLKICRAAGGNA